MNHTPTLVLIDTKSLHVSRYVGKTLTHRAEASWLDRALIKHFRDGPPDEFAVSSPLDAA